MILVSPKPGVTAAVSIKAYKYRIYANKATTEKLQWTLARCRELYNAGLQERRDAYEMAVRRHPGYYDEKTRKQLTRKHAVGYYEQKRELVDIKEEKRRATRLPPLSRQKPL